MKVLWFTNNLLPKIAEENGIKASVNEGWVEGMLDAFRLSEDDIEICLACSQTEIKNTLQGVTSTYRYYAYYEKSRNSYDSNLQKDLIKIIKEFNPDIIHIMGSEYPHTYSAILAAEECGLLERTIISIQGLLFYIHMHLEEEYKSLKGIHPSLRDMIKGGGIRKLSKEYYYRKEYEKKAFQLAQHVIGRTDWDKKASYLLNPKLQYHFNNEVLREPFYEGDIWSLERCEKHAIFFSQISNPIKGFHYLLEALPIVKKYYGDVKVYVAGSDVFKSQERLSKGRRTEYVNYIFGLIEKNNLKENIIFCGSLNSIEMKERYIKSHIFISSSIIENSPNSVCEAMILGVPVISSNVGGVSSIISNNEGLLYPVHESYILAANILELFSNNDLCEEISKKAREKALQRHDKNRNAKDLASIYRSCL